MVLDYLQTERDGHVRYDILLVNCGLHDIKTHPYTGVKQIPLEQYRANLEKIARFAREMAQTFIWIRTTDAVEDIHNTEMSTIFRFHQDVLAYNAIADEVMRAHGVPLIDLYTFTRCFGISAFCDHVHYTDEVRALQAAYIAGYLEAIESTQSVCPK
jgi:hypothetical protein